MKKKMTTNQWISKEKCQLSCRTAQDLNVQLRSLSEVSRSRSKSESELKSKPTGETNIKMIQVSSNCEQTCFAHIQVADNIEIRDKVASKSKEESSNDEDPDDYLESERIMVPCDPSKWNSSHISSWISWCSQTFSIKPTPIATIFPSTGKELLKLSLRDWQDIGGATGGRLLAQHLGHLRLQATGVYIPDLLQENEKNAARQCREHRRYTELQILSIRSISFLHAEL